MIVQPKLILRNCPPLSEVPEFCSQILIHELVSYVPIMLSLMLLGGILWGKELPFTGPRSSMIVRKVVLTGAFACS